MRRIIFYKTASGDSPVEEFIGSLPSKTQQKIAWVLKIVKELPVVNRQFLKKLAGTKDIWEVRIDSGSDTFRILGFFDRGDLVILTNGFAKKTGKTPPKEIKLAEERKSDYERRKDG